MTKTPGMGNKKAGRFIGRIFAGRNAGLQPGVLEGWIGSNSEVIGGFAGG